MTIGETVDACVKIIEKMETTAPEVDIPALFSCLVSKFGDDGVGYLELSYSLWSDQNE